MKEESNSFIELAQRYLRQQSEQYGAVIYKEGAMPKQKIISSIKSVKQGSSSEVKDLFGNRISNSIAEMETWQQAETIPELNELICDCQKCPLGQTRTNFVFGVGNPNAKAVLIGEAPGADEDAKGEPFVGRAGQLLNKILAAINFQREDVFICNILKCRPPNNRDPLPSEVETCEPYLHKQLDILQPKIMLALGRIAGQTLLRTNDTLTKLRETVHSYHGIPLIVTFHPAAILRNPNWKKPTWDDVQKFRKMYDELTGV